MWGCPQIGVHDCIYLSTEPPWGRSRRGRGAGRARGRRRKMATSGLVKYPALVLFYYNIILLYRWISIHKFKVNFVRFYNIILMDIFFIMILHTVQWSYEWSTQEGNIKSCHTQTSNGGYRMCMPHNIIVSFNFVCTCPCMRYPTIYN
jgi:hypothetical protein